MAADVNATQTRNLELGSSLVDLISELRSGDELARFVPTAQVRIYLAQSMAHNMKLARDLSAMRTEIDISYYANLLNKQSRQRELEA